MLFKTINGNLYVAENLIFKIGIYIFFSFFCGGGRGVAELMHPAYTKDTSGSPKSLLFTMVGDEAVW